MDLSKESYSQSNEIWIHQMKQEITKQGNLTVTKYFYQAQWVVE